MEGVYNMENDFINDEEKMIDFVNLSKEDFLLSYSYLTESDYDETMRLYNNR